MLDPIRMTVQHKDNKNNIVFMSFKDQTAIPLKGDEIFYEGIYYVVHKRLFIYTQANNQIKELIIKVVPK